MTTLHALVLAGSRVGERDPVARVAGVAHKVLAPVAGIPMISRVLSVLAGVGAITGIAVATTIESELRRLPGVAELERSGRLRFLPSGDSPSGAVLDAFARLAPPLLVTTGDHPLLDGTTLERFLDAAAGRDCDLAVGLVERRVIAAALPGTRRTYLRFRDLAVSGANLFLLRTPLAARALEVWRRVEAARKRPWRIAATFGPRLLVGYALRRLTLERACALAGERIGVRVLPVLLPSAKAAVDVDRPDDLALAEHLLARRTAGAERP